MSDTMTMIDGRMLDCDAHLYMEPDVMADIVGAAVCGLFDAAPGVASVCAAAAPAMPAARANASVTGGEYFIGILR